MWTDHPRHRADRFGKDLHRLVQLVGRRDQRRREKVGVSLDPAEQSSLGGQAVNLRSNLGVGWELALRRSILDQLHGTHQSLAANVPNVGVVVQRRVEGAEQVSTFGVCLFPGTVPLR